MMKFSLGLGLYCVVPIFRCAMDPFVNDVCTGSSIFYSCRILNVSFNKKNY